MENQEEKLVNQFATASRWRMRMRKTIVWLVIGFLVIIFFLFYAWWQQHGVNRIISSLPNNTTFYLSTSQQSLFSKENIFDNPLWKSLYNKLDEQGYNFDEISQSIKYAAFVLTDEEGINRHLFLQCATFECTNILLNQYPQKAQLVNPFIIAISLDELLSLDNQENWTQKLPKQLQYSDFAIFIDQDLITDLTNQLEINFDNLNINSDIFLAINQQENYFDFELIANSEFKNITSPQLVYPVAENSVLSFGATTVNDLNFVIGNQNDHKYLSLNWKRLFNKDFSSELQEFYQQPLAIQIVFNEEVKSYEPIFVFENTPSNLLAINEFIPMWLAQKFPTTQEKILPDNTLATHLVSQVSDWQWKKDLSDNRLMVIGNKDGVKIFVYAVNDKYLFVGKSVKSIQQILDASYLSTDLITQDCQSNNYSLMTFSKTVAMSEWLQALPDFALVVNNQNRGVDGCIFW